MIISLLYDFITVFFFRFANMREDDLDCMESNYATVMKEEARR